MPSVEQIKATVQRYLELVDHGTADELAELYAEGATLEDPVGSEPKTGRAAIREFYKVIEPIERSAKLVSLHAAADTAVFQFRIVTVFGDTTVDLTPADIMVFDDAGKIASMRAVWSADDMTTTRATRA